MWDYPSHPGKRRDPGATEHAQPMLMCEATTGPVIEKYEGWRKFAREREHFGLTPVHPGDKRRQCGLYGHGCRYNPRCIRDRYGPWPTTTLGHDLIAHSCGDNKIAE